MSYAKIELFDNLIQSDTPEDPYLSVELEAYFPTRLMRRFGNAMLSHPLRREIIAMRIANSIVNRMGASFAIRAQEDTGSSAEQIARAYAIAREIFDAREIWRQIEDCDHRVPAEVQYDLLFQVSRRMRHAVHWLLQRQADSSSTEEMVRQFSAGVKRVRGSLAKQDHVGNDDRYDAPQLKRLGVPVTLARQLEPLVLATQTLEIIEIATELQVDVTDVATLYFELGKVLRLDWIRASIEGLKVDGRWPATARATLREHLAQRQNALIRSILSRDSRRSPSAELAEWLDASKDKISRVRQNLNDMEASDVVDFATLSVAIREIERLTS